MELNILPGDRAEMIPSGQIMDELIHIKKYISSIEDISGNRLILGMPMIKGRYVPMHRGDKYDVFVYHQEKIYMCCTEVEGAQRDGNRVELIVKMLTEPKKFDRRAFYRLAYDIPVIYLTLDDKMTELFRKTLKEKKEIPTDGYKKGTSIDLSAGGIKFTSKSPLKEDDVVCIQFVLDEGKATEMTFTLLAHVIDSQAHPELKGIYIHRAAFEMLHTKDRERLVAFIFKQQRQSLQRK